MPPLGIKRFRKKEKFEKAYKKLDPEIKLAVDDAIKDLLKDPPPAGRRIKKMGGHHNPDIWEIRVNHNFRMTFEIQDDIATLRNVGSHNLLYRNP